jgi:hypothetical protein
MLKQHIIENKNMFKNSTIVGDRAYFSYELLGFLIKSNINFIIRCKGKANNFNLNAIIKTKNKDIINYVRTNCSVLKYSDVYEKTVFSHYKKKFNPEKKILQVKNDCNLVTNIKNYNKKEILKIYRSRWSIETFFKIIKNNFKIQHTKEKCKNNDHIEKIFSCTSIIINLVSIIEEYFLQKNKLNKSMLIRCIYTHLLDKIINGNLSINDLNNISMYTKVVINKKNRTFPRISKTAFTKWYVKSYSIYAEINKIINSIVTNDVDKLNKNKKLLAKRILSIKINDSVVFNSIN